MSSVLGPALAAALLTVAAAGCGGDDEGEGDAAPTTAADVPPPAPACDLLDTESVSDLFGAEAVVVPAAGTVAGEGSCLWEANDAAAGERHQLQLSVYADGRPLSPEAWGEGPEPVDGLGDEAFVVAEGGLGTTTGYRDGDRSVVLRYAVLGPEGPGAPEQADALVDLLRDAASASP